ncbi:MAG: hypothetical protein F6J87_05185 [Spirulina sp. SIO3F2]|nr:hypothetical protein [Spirulina sp. SIO3F2]
MKIKLIKFRPPKKIDIQKYRLRLLYATSASITSILTIWFFAGYHFAGKAEEAIDSEIEKMHTVCPKREANSAASKYKILSEQLFISNTKRREGTQYPNYSTYVYSEYIYHALKSQSVDTISPKKLQRYLIFYSDEINQIRDHLLTSKSLDFGQDYDLKELKEKDYFSTISSRSFVEIQEILMLDLLHKSAKDQTRLFFDTLKASDVLQYSLQDNNCQSWSQLATIKELLEVQWLALRLIKTLPSKWENRLVKNKDSAIYPHRISFVQKLAGFYRTRNDTEYFVSSDREYQEKFHSARIIKLVQSLQKPYLIFVAFDNWNRNDLTAKTIRNKINDEGICKLDPNKIQRNLSTSSWWSFASQYNTHAARNIVWYARYLVHRELTIKVLQLKEMANQNGQFPKRFPGIEKSEVCNDLRWQYTVTEDGQKMTIQINSQYFPKVLETTEFERTGCEIPRAENWSCAPLSFTAHIPHNE